MTNRRMILCGTAPGGSLPSWSDNPVMLCMHGPESINLKINDIQDQMLSEIPSQFVDLIEIATYIYCADQIVTRGGSGVDNVGENWRRELHFRIPVRHPEIWSDASLLEALTGTLSFLSDDEYSFEFSLYEDPPAFGEYICSAQNTPDYIKPKEVVMFSGGLDSLGGAIQESIINKRRIVLVTHKPTQKLSRRHRELVNGLYAHCQESPPIYLPVKINKGNCKGSEYTQRSRSFLYASLGATVAQMLDLQRIRFYENGPISLNLPVNGQVIGARATRTTHPQVLEGFARIFSALAGRQFDVENPFMWKTKTEVLQLIKDAGCADLVKHSTSCTHTWQMTKLWTHCGTCSQCIDRRFATLAAGLDGDDPEESYRVDLLTGERQEGPVRTMLASYVETAKKISQMNDLQFFSEFGEAARVLRHLGSSPAESAKNIYQLHQRHAAAVTGVITNGIAHNAEKIVNHELHPSSLLRMVYETSIPAEGTVSAPVTVEPIPELTVPVRTVAEKVIAVDGDYIFMKKGKNWVGRFSGSEAQIYTPDKGYAYLNILFSNIGKVFTAAELEFQVNNTPDQYLITGADDALDREALESYKLHLAVQNEELTKAEEDNDLAAQARIKQEINAIKQQLSRDINVHGQVRKLKDEKNRCRNRVSKAIRDAVKKIAQYDPSFGEHLDPKKPRLKLGWEIYYHPQADIEWET